MSILLCCGKKITHLYVYIAVPLLSLSVVNMLACLHNVKISAHMQRPICVLFAFCQGG